MNLRTPLANVKGLGSAKSGFSHWWMQRMTALALIPLAVWFVVNIIRGAHSGVFILSFMTSPLNAVLAVLFLGTSLYHGMLGIQVVIEDYVHCNCAKLTLLTLLKFFTILTVVASIMAVVALHANALLLQAMQAN